MALPLTKCICSQWLKLIGSHSWKKRALLILTMLKLSFVLTQSDSIADGKIEGDIILLGNFESEYNWDEDTEKVSFLP